MSYIDSETKKQILSIFQSLDKESVPKKGEGWVKIETFGSVIKQSGIDYRHYGFTKLVEFVAASRIFMIWDDYTRGEAIKYIHEKDMLSKRPRISTQQPSTILHKTRRIENSEEIERVKTRLRLENNYFIGQFSPEKTENWYKISDIRNTDFTKIEDKEKGIKDLTIAFSSKDKFFNRFAYYKFTWVLLGTSPLKFGIDLREEVSPIYPKDIVDCLHDSIVRYPASAAKKITRTLDTLNKQLTQSGKEVFIYELLQNANDYPRKQKIGSSVVPIPVDVEFHITNEYLTFQHTGEYFNPKNIAAICDINDGEKSDNIEAIGYKGIGFKTVFLDNDYVYLSTGKYSFRFDKSATDIINTPWQILPVWTDTYRVPQLVKNIFNNHTNEDFRVKFALKPRDSRILTDRERKDNYIDLFSSVFDTERVILFIPNIRKVSIFFEDTTEPSIVREKNSRDWCVSEAMIDDVPEFVRERINDVLTNQDADKSDGYEKVPEKYLNFNKTAIKFACKRNGNKLLPVDDAILYCYLPAKRADWGFKFLMNTDMVPNGARDDIEDIELNHEIAKIAGRQFFYWIKSLIECGDYELDSIFSLIPDFNVCKERHKDYKTFIKEFQKEFEELVYNEEFVPVVDANREKSLATIDTIVNDLTDITRDGVMADEDFITIMGFSNYHLPIKELRESRAFMSFLNDYSPSNLDVSFEDVKGKCSNNNFVEWLKDVDNNNKFISHLLEKDVIELFENENIFIEYEADLFSASSLYYDFDTHCSDIPFLRTYIPHLAKSSRDFFEGNEKWHSFVDAHFMKFNANELLDNYVFDNDKAFELLERMDNSICFFKFIAKYEINLSDRKDKFPYLDEDGKVHRSFDGLLFFYCNQAFRVSQAKWLGDNTITILSHEYLENDTDNAIKSVFEGLGFSDYDEKSFIMDSVVGDSVFRKEVNIAISEDFEVNVSFLKFVYAAREHLKEKEGQLKDYVLRCLDIDNTVHYLCADDLRYFSMESYAGNTTFAENTKHSWLSNDMMYCFDNTYFEQFSQQERKQLESFLRQSFSIRTFTNKSFFFDVVIANKKYVYGLLDNKDILQEFIKYLIRDEKDIFDKSLAFGVVDDMPLLCYDGTVIAKRNNTRLIEYSEAAVDLYEKDWCIEGVFSVMDKSYSELSKDTIQFLKIETLDIPEVMNDIIHRVGFTNIVKSGDNNIDFWKYVKTHVKAFESLDMFNSVCFAVEENDETYLKGSKLYISDIYQRDGIESLVKEYDKSAHFVSHKYLESDTESNKQEWFKLFKKIGLRSDNKDLLFTSVIPNLSDIEDDAVVSMMTKHLKDLKEEWGLYKNQLLKLKVRTRSGQYQTLDKTIIININEDNVAEPFKCVELQGEIAPEILSANKEIVQLIVAGFQHNYIYTSKQEWAQAKLNEYVDTIQLNKEKADAIHIDFVRELATLVANDYSFSKSSIDKLLFKEKTDAESYLSASQLTLGTIYKPICDFESNGIAELHYLSEEYLSENNKDTIRGFFKKTDIHQSFETTDISLLADRAFALYFWGRYFTHRLTEFKEWVEKGVFDKVACIPTEGAVASPQELYSPEIFHFAKYTKDWEKKVPSSSVVNNIKDEDARRIFLSMPFKKKLNFEDCLYYLLTAKEKLLYEYRNREQVVDWILEDANHDEQLVLWYREQPSATWRNGKGQLTHIKDLYAIHPEASQERNIFGGNEHILQTSMFPFDPERFESVCDILKIKYLKESDFKTTPINPNDETVDIFKKIMPKILVLAAIAKPEKYQPLYERYAADIKKYRFLVCDKIDLGYDSIHNDIERIYSDNEHIYYVNSWLHNRTYTKFCSKLRNLLGIEVYADVCEDVLDDSVSVEECIEKYCSSLVRDESFRQYLQELNHTITDFEEEYEPEMDDDNYYEEVGQGEEYQEPDIDDIISKTVEQEENTFGVDDENKDEIGQTDQKSTKKTSNEQLGSSSVNKLETESEEKTSVEPKTPNEKEESDHTTLDVSENRKNEVPTSTDEPSSLTGKEQNASNLNHESKVSESDDGSSEFVLVGDGGVTNSEHTKPSTDSTKWGQAVHSESDEGFEDILENEDDIEDDEPPQTHNVRNAIKSGTSKPSINHGERKPHGAYRGKWEPAQQDSPFVRQKRNFSGYSPDRFKARQFDAGTQEPLTLSRKDISENEVQYLSKLLGRAMNVDVIKDENYIVRMRFYNSLRENGLEMDMDEKDFIENGTSKVVTKSGKYIHRCSARSGIIYISPTVWNRLREGCWVICFYSGKMADQFVYVRNQDELMEIINQDALVIQVTGNNKQEIVDKIYEDGFNEMDGNIFTLIRTIKVDGEVTPFDENITDYFSDDDDQDTDSLL